MTNDEQTEMFQELRERQAQMDAEVQRIRMARGWRLMFETEDEMVPLMQKRQRTFFGGRDAGGKGAGNRQLAMYAAGMLAAAQQEVMRRLLIDGEVTVTGRRSRWEKGVYEFSTSMSAFMAQSKLAAKDMADIEARLIADGYRCVYGDEWVKTMQENAPAKSPQEKAPEKGPPRFMASTGRTDALMDAEPERRWYYVDMDSNASGLSYRDPRTGMMVTDPFPSLMDGDRRYLTVEFPPVNASALGTLLHAQVEAELTRPKGRAPIQHGPVTGKHAKKRRWG